MEVAWGGPEERDEGDGSGVYWGGVGGGTEHGTVAGESCEESEGKSGMRVWVGGGMGMK